MTTNDQQFHSWIGNTETAEDHISTAPLLAMAAMLDRDPLAAADPIPPLWHWLYFLNPARQSQIAADGHPRKGGFLPLIDLPRRMWAGSRIQFHQPLLAGDSIQRKSEILSITTKQGRSGQLAFVCVGHSLSTDRGLALYEEHDIVYRSPQDKNASAAADIPAPDDKDFARTVSPDPVMLFRYSALTFNGHRIHYDREYATETEGYGGLIVHGPLLATLLLDVLLENLPQARVEKFEFRAIKPVFDLEDFQVCGKKPDSNNECELWIRDSSGSLCMRATATVVV